MLLIGSCVALSGCAREMGMKMEMQMSGELQMKGPSVVFEGMYISDALYERVTPGDTTDRMVTALFGPPAHTYPLADGTVIWKWIYREHGFDTTMFTVVGKGDENSPSQPQQITFVRFRNGIAVEKWRD